MLLCLFVHIIQWFLCIQMQNDILYVIQLNFHSPMCLIACLSLQFQVTCISNYCELQLQYLLWDAGLNAHPEACGLKLDIVVYSLIFLRHKMHSLTSMQAWVEYMLHLLMSPFLLYTGLFVARCRMFFWGVEEWK